MLLSGGPVPERWSLSGAERCLSLSGVSERSSLSGLSGAIEKALGREAIKEMLPMQAGDVPATFADIEDLANDVGFRPKTSIEDGVAKFVQWYRDYYKV